MTALLALARRLHGRHVARLGAALLVGSVAALLLVVVPAFATIAEPGASRVFRQPDGTRFRAHLWGDEFYHGYEVNGFTILQDPRTRWWTYARVVDAAVGRLVPSTRRVAKEAPAGPRHLRDQVLVARGMQLAASAHAQRRDADGGTGGSLLPDGPQFPNNGHAPGLVILAEFTTAKNKGSSAASWAAKFFGDTNSVADYYEEVSRGKFLYTPAAEQHGTFNDGVIGWVSVNLAHPGADTQVWVAPIAAAIRAADPYVNYGAYDTNRDGWIQPNELHITVIAAGGEAATSCAQPAVWAHRGSLGSAAPSVDGTRAGGWGYTVFGEQQCGGGVHAATIGVIAHELGHDLGLPDLYDVDKSSQGGVGTWSLMASGNWNQTSSTAFAGTAPAHLDAWSKYYEGWLEPTAVTTNQTGVSVPRAETSLSALRILNNPNGVDWSFTRQAGTGEYFLVENRTRIGYDVGLPGCGILIWHIDETRTPHYYFDAALDKYVNANSVDSRRMVQLAEANANEYPREAGDAWVGARTFSDSTTPNAKLYSGASTGIRLSNFSACGPTMTLDVQVAGGGTAVPNDNFASATAIGAFPFTQTGLSNANATVQTGEQGPTCAQMGRTVWYRFTAASALKVTVSTAGSTVDTVVGAWRGTAMNALTEVKCDDDGGANHTSLATFDAAAGQTYYVQVGSFADATTQPASGLYNVSITAVSAGIANDAFAGATTIGSFPFTRADVDTSGATTEAGEPVPTCGPTGKTLWYRFTAASNLSVTATTSGSNFDTVLQVWRGTTIGGLTAIGCNDDYAGSGGYSQVTFAAQAGQTYYLQVGGFNDNGSIKSGLLDLAVTAAAAGPANDQFASATNVASLPYSQSGLATGGATTQAGEPAATCGGIGKTVWYRYVPAVDTTVTASTSGSSFDTVLQVWRGTAIDGLTAITCSDDAAESGGPSQVQFSAVVGQTYYLQVGGFADTTSTASGSLTVAISGVATGLANDAFSKATVISALPYSTSGVATGTATTETSEPDASCAGSAGKTVWYRWTATSSGTITVSSEGSSFDTVVAVWRGTSISALTEMGCSDDFAGPEGYSKVQVAVTAGQTYYIQAGGYADASTPARSGSLSLSVVAP